MKPKTKMNDAFKMRFSNSELTKEEMNILSSEDWNELYLWEKRRSRAVNNTLVDLSQGLVKVVIIVVVVLLVFGGLTLL